MTLLQFHRRSKIIRMVEAGAGVACLATVGVMFALRARGDFMASPDANMVGMVIVTVLSVAGFTLVADSLRPRAIQLLK